VQNTMQQIGSALGLAVLVTLALRHAATGLQRGEPAALAVTGGYALAFRAGAVLMVLGGVLVALLFERVDPVPRNPTVERLAAAG